MSTSATATAPPSLVLQKADRVGVAASILCAIHCGLAPILLIALPTFGRVWAHPASHILVAIFVVPLAVFSISKGYHAHQKRWILIMASIGILLVLIGAVLPAFSKKSEASTSPSTQAPAGIESGVSASTAAATFGSDGSKGDCSHASSEDAPTQAAGCVDNCCPSLQVDETGMASWHIPPAAIVTTLGGLFLITAHIGNLCSCGHSCRTSRCTDCE